MKYEIGVHQESNRQFSLYYTIMSTETGLGHFRLLAEDNGSVRIRLREKVFLEGLLMDVIG